MLLTDSRAITLAFLMGNLNHEGFAVYHILDLLFRALFNIKSIIGAVHFNGKLASCYFATIFLVIHRDRNTVTIAACNAMDVNLGLTGSGCTSIAVTMAIAVTIAVTIRRKRANSHHAHDQTHSHKSD